MAGAYGVGQTKETVQGAKFMERTTVVICLPVNLKESDDHHR